MKENIPKAVTVTLIGAGIPLVVFLGGAGQELEPAGKIFLTGLFMFVAIQLIPAFVLFGSLAKEVFSWSGKRQEQLARAESRREATLAANTNETGQS